MSVIYFAVKKESSLVCGKERVLLLVCVKSSYFVLF